MKSIESLKYEIYNELMDNNFVGCEATINRCFDEFMGENAHKMLDIGIVQDELVKLGFKHEVRSSKFNIINLDCLQLLLPESHSRYWIEVRFTKDYAYLSQTDERFFFTVENWKQDLLSKVKKLIGGEK